MFKLNSKGVPIISVSESFLEDDSSDESELLDLPPLELDSFPSLDFESDSSDEDDPFSLLSEDDEDPLELNE